MRVRLPALAQASADASPGTAKREVERRAPRAHLRIVLVEDNEDAREALRELLELWGHEVHVAADGESGLEMVRRLRPQLVLMDVGLPGLNGFEVARRLRAEEFGKEMKLVALTGYGSAAHKQIASDSGFDKHLTKPVDPEALDALLRGA